MLLPAGSCGSDGSLKCSRTAQQRMTELEARVETMQETIDQAFRVEMMKMPPSLLSTRMGALMGGGLLLFLLFLSRLSPGSHLHPCF